MGLEKKANKRVDFSTKPGCSFLLTYHLTPRLSMIGHIIGAPSAIEVIGSGY
jgi:hypothetical protein